MSTENTDYTGEATYCPEDNKLRLYVGRVPRDEYLRLRAEGWTALHKQRETGGGDFAATWTPQRRDTALAYAGFIGDEDKGPAERAAERAERFGGYLEKRLGEATERADRYNAGPQVHGYQSQSRAERAALRHDRIASKAVDAWDKAEYWQSRTAGVISHALHVSSPSVRMGRIKELELAIARHEKHEREDSWTTHYRNRLSYENAMLEACGGRAAVVEMVPGGFYNGAQIQRITKSPATGQAVSVMVKGKCRVYNRATGGYVVEDGLHCINIERDTAGAYRAPTPEELAAFEANKKAEKKARAQAKKDSPPEPKLINPTDEDAERLQALLNANMLASLRSRASEFKPSEVLRITQAVYSANSGGSYARAGTKSICGGGVVFHCYSQFYGDERKRLLEKQGPIICHVRTAHRSAFYSPDRVVILTDKPQKPLPAAVWASVAAETINA